MDAGGVGLMRRQCQVALSHRVGGGSFFFLNAKDLVIWGRIVVCLVDLSRVQFRD
jgi:hypothetical protein